MLNTLEEALTEYLADNLFKDCGGRRRMDMALTAVQRKKRMVMAMKVDASPQDEILIQDTFCSPETCCGSGCSLVGGTVTLTQEADSPSNEEDVCALLEAIEAFMNSSGPGDVEGLGRVYYVPSKDNDEDFICKKEQGIPLKSVAVEQNPNNSKKTWHYITWPAMGAALVVALFAINRRRNRQSQMTKFDDNALMLNDDETTTESFVTSTPASSPEKEILFSTTDVKKCESGMCDNCRVGPGLSFVKTKSDISQRSQFTQRTELPAIEIDFESAREVMEEGRPLNKNQSNLVESPGRYSSTISI